MGFSISGLARSGKDTVADYLCEHKGYTKGHFARSLKSIAKNYLTWNGEKDEKGRRLLQVLGTEVARTHCKDSWLHMVCLEHGLSPKVELEKMPAQLLNPSERAQLFDAHLETLGLLPKKELVIGVFPCSYPEITKRVGALLDFHVEDHLITLASLICLCELGAAHTLFTLKDGKTAPVAEDPYHDLSGASLVARFLTCAHEYNPRLTGLLDILDYDRLAEMRTKYIEFYKPYEFSDENPKVVIPDTRFPNELKLLSSMGFTTVKVERPGVKKMGHASENALDEESYDVLIQNDSSLESLYEKVEKLLK